MEYSKAKSELIAAWGTLGSSWGVNRTMAMIHALLMISPEALSTEEVMGELKISRGNANMNLRALMDWGLAEKRVKPGERKEYFYTTKDVWDLARKVAEERKRRELDPILRVLNMVQEVEGDGEEAETFRKVTQELHSFASQSSALIDTFTGSKANWVLKVLGLFKKK
ncbi:MAG TPA: transcriptional regulator [Cytophagales bacterium]|nr:transcriptional regulator [Cytophagales bacterium]HAA23463.1 transcriptional regulator [Cytophagales bacterium]HAP60660.1 transcriptional regulator [Cytophagales bacterium]